MDASVESMSTGELQDLLVKVQLHIKVAEAKARDDAMKEILAIAKRIGMPLQTILVGAKNAGANRTASPVATKYADPANPSNSWTGRGARPRWLKIALSEGKQLDAFRLAQ